MTDDEATLASRSRSGDRRAFEALVRCSSRWIYARLYLDTGDAHRAEDLTQETFLAAWRQIHTLAEPSAFRGWLAAIAHRTLLDSIKHERRKKRRSLLASRDPDTVAAGTSAADLATDTEQRKRALAILREMPEPLREPLMLRYLGGADYETIGRQLSLTNGSLRGLLQRGMKMLRERMNVDEVRDG